MIDAELFVLAMILSLPILISIQVAVALWFYCY